jgi:hypothetical protein
MIAPLAQGRKTSPRLRTTNPQENAFIRRIHKPNVRGVRHLNGFRKFPSRVFGLVAFVAVVCASGTARAEVPTGQTIDGMSCDRAEGAVFHIHQHVAILDHGKPVPIPSDVGQAIGASCLYWMHTHTPDGIVHIESPKFRTFFLGDFFDVWGQPLSATAVGPVRVTKGALRTYVDGTLYKGDPRKIEMSQHTDVTLEAGPPYAKPAPFTDWGGQ